MSEPDPAFDNYSQRAAELGWDDETTADNLERFNDPRLAALFRARAAESVPDAATTAPKERKSAAEADQQTA